MSAEGPRILVVDDDVDIGANLQEILTDLGYTVEMAHDGPTALDLIGQHSFTVALLDLKLPGMDGLTLSRELKRRRDETVVLLVTTFAGGDSAERALLFHSSSRPTRLITSRSTVYLRRTRYEMNASQSMNDVDPEFPVGWALPTVLIFRLDNMFRWWAVPTPQEHSAGDPLSSRPRAGDDHGFGEGLRSTCPSSFGSSNICPASSNLG